MTSSPSKLTGDDRSALREFMTARFVQSELDAIAFDLGADPSNFSRNLKPAFVIELIQYFESRDRIHELISAVIARRQGVEGVQRFENILTPPEANSTKSDSAKGNRPSPPKTPLPRPMQARRPRDVIALLGLVVAAIAAVATVTTPEIRCALRLGDCSLPITTQPTAIALPTTPTMLGVTVAVSPSQTPLPAPTARPTIPPPTVTEVVPTTTELPSDTPKLVPTEPPTILPPMVAEAVATITEAPTRTPNPIIAPTETLQPITRVTNVSLQPNLTTKSKLQIGCIAIVVLGPEPDQKKILWEHVGEKIAGYIAIGKRARLIDNPTSKGFVRILTLDEPSNLSGFISQEFLEPQSC